MLFGSPLFAKGAAALNVADVFSTDLYTGNGSTQTITNGINLADEGGLVWSKSRSSASWEHVWTDTIRGGDSWLRSNSTGAEDPASGIRTFARDGFTTKYNITNETNTTYAAWTFRRAPKFFDVVTYTGNGVAGRTIPHNLGVAPGMIVVKKRSGTANWFVYHRANTAEPETDALFLNSTAATTDNSTWWNDTAPSSTEFTLGNDSNVNQSGGTYVAYLFAHDPSPSGVIQCGSYTGNGSATGPVINLGWEPQWVMIKNATNVGNWAVLDTARGLGPGAIERIIFANTSGSESAAAEVLDTTSTGFQLKSLSFNDNGQTFIYMAIRKEGV